MEHPKTYDDAFRLLLVQWGHLKDEEIKIYPSKTGKRISIKAKGIVIDITPRGFWKIHIQKDEEEEMKSRLPRPITGDNK